MSSRMKKRYKTPSDLRRDHRNFTSHLAGDRQISFDNFDKENIGQYVAGVESGHGEIVIKRPKGRLTFDSNLLTAGQIKFSNHDLSANVRQNIAKRLYDHLYSENATVQPKDYIHSDANTGWSGFEQVKGIYDAVYNILENFRASKKSAEHFNRPKILRDHLKDVANAQAYGYETNIKYTENDHDSDWIKLAGLKFQVDWNELRQWIYSNKKLDDIENPIVKSIIQRHKDLLTNASQSMNNSSPIHAALTVALDFELSAIDTFTTGINTRKKGLKKTREEDQNTYQNAEYTQTTLGHDIPEETIEDLSKDILKDAVMDYQSGINERLKRQGLPNINIDPNDDQTFEVSRKHVENLKNTEKMNVLCTGEVAENQGIEHFESSIDLSSIQLDESLDRQNQSIGSHGYKLTRRAWRLPYLGDVNVFKQHPPTSADLITLIDGSGSMGRLRPSSNERYHEWYANDPLQQAADMALAIKKRFPDSKAFIFGDFPYEDRYQDNRYDAALYEINNNEFPKYPSSGTPLCGALKALEKEFSLDHARILIATDGDANWCKTGDPYECVYNILTSWRNKGVRIATLFTPNWDGQKVPQSLHGDVTISAKRDEPIDDLQIKQVFNFIKG